MSEPLVSVSMITYNQQPYIGEAIECVLRQETEDPFELVIGEDCSMDGTREIVEDYRQRHPDLIRVIRSERNVGLRENDARTLAACRGQYIAFCEGDDFWHRRDKLRLQVEYLEAHPECGMVCSDFDLYDEATGRTVACFNRHTRMSLPPAPDIYGILTDQYRVLTLTVLARRHIIDEITTRDPHLYRGNTFLMGDTQRWAEVALISRIGYLDESLGTYRKLRESVSQSGDARKQWRYAVSADEMRLYLCDKHHLSPDLRERFWRRWCKGALELAFLEGDLPRAQEVLRQGYQLSPAERVKYMSLKNRRLHACLRTVLSLRRRLGERKG